MHTRVRFGSLAARVHQLALTTALVSVALPALAFPVEDAITEQNTQLIYNEEVKANEKLKEGNKLAEELLDAHGKAGPVSSPSTYTLGQTIRSALSGLQQQQQPNAQAWGLPQDLPMPRLGSFNTGVDFFSSSLTAGFRPTDILQQASQLTGTTRQKVSTTDGDMIIRRRDDKLQQAALLGLAVAAASNETLDAAFAQADQLPSRVRSVAATKDRLAILADGFAALTAEMAANRAVNTQLLQLNSARELKYTNVVFGVTAPGAKATPLPQPGAK